MRWTRKILPLIRGCSIRELRRYKQKHLVTAGSQSLRLSMGVISQTAVISGTEHQQHRSILQEELPKMSR
jgi:hypothetical protein